MLAADASDCLAPALPRPVAPRAPEVGLDLDPQGEAGAQAALLALGGAGSSGTSAPMVAMPPGRAWPCTAVADAAHFPIRPLSRTKAGKEREPWVQVGDEETFLK